MEEVKNLLFFIGLQKKKKMKTTSDGYRCGSNCPINVGLTTVDVLRTEPYLLDATQ